MEHSIAWEMLKLFKVALIILAIIAVAELGVIGYMGYMLYDGQFEYVESNSQDLDEVDMDNSSVSLN